MRKTAEDSLLPLVFAVALIEFLVRPEKTGWDWVNQWLWRFSAFIIWLWVLGSVFFSDRFSGIWSILAVVVGAAPLIAGVLRREWLGTLAFLFPYLPAFPIAALAWLLWQLTSRVLPFTFQNLIAAGSRITGPKGATWTLLFFVLLQCAIASVETYPAVHYTLAALSILTTIVFVWVLLRLLRDPYRPVRYVFDRLATNFKRKQGQVEAALRENPTGTQLRKIKRRLSQLEQSRPFLSKMKVDGAELRTYLLYGSTAALLLALATIAIGFGGAIYSLRPMGSPFGSLSDSFSYSAAVYFSFTILATVAELPLSQVSPLGRSLVVLEMVLGLLALGLGFPISLFALAAEKVRAENVFNNFRDVVATNLSGLRKDLDAAERGIQEPTRRED